MRKWCSAKLALAAVAAFAAVVPASSESRDNPFVPPPSEQELQARMDERMRNIILEVQPEIRANIMQDVHAAQATLEIRLRRRIDEAVRTAAPPVPVAASQPSLIDGIVEAVTPESKVPEGATFISCVNGKALYRDDREHVLFQVEGDGAQGSDRCAR